MITIHKHYVPPDGGTLRLPHDAQFLTAQLQGEYPQLWFAVNTDNPTEPRRFEWYGTGHEVTEPDGLHYRATVQLAQGLVFHLFERIARRGFAVGGSA